MSVLQQAEESGIPANVLPVFNDGIDVVARLSPPVASTARLPAPAVQAESGTETKLGDGIDYVSAHCRLFGLCLDPDTQAGIPQAAHAVMLSSASKIMGGRIFAHEASKHRAGYDAPALDASLSAASKQAPLLCDVVRASCPGMCPSGRNCLLPTHSPVKNPGQLIAWKGRSSKPSDVPHPTRAQAFVDRYFPEGLVNTQGKLWGYRDGAFDALDKEVQIDRPMVEMLGPLATNSLTNSLTALAGKIVAAKTEHFESFATTHLCLKNGTLRLPEGILEAHSPAHRLQTRLPIAWDAEAQCPRFLDFLDSIFSVDDDKAEKIRLVQQWLGYIITPDMRQSVMLWLYGEGSNGKSVLADVTRKLVGDAYVSALNLNDLGNTFNRAELIGKTLNISGDLPKKAIGDGYVKALISGDPIQARGWDCPSVSFKPTVRFMACMNTLPDTMDVTDGYFRRIVLLPFNRRFRGAEVNHNLTAELLDELPGILAWAVEGFKDLQRSGRFSIPTSSVAALEDYRRQADPARAFVEECLRQSSDGSGYQPAALLRVFREWAKEVGLKGGEVSPTSFGKTLDRMGFEQRRSGRRYWLVEPQEHALTLFVAVGVAEAEDDTADLYEVMPVSQLAA